MERDGSVRYGSDSNVEVLYSVELRQRYIRVRIDVDKNVDGRREVYAYIPEAIPTLGVRPVRLLEDYLRRLRPPSGGFLLAAPHTRTFSGALSFRATPYSGFSRAFRAAYARAWPNPALRSAHISRVGSHSGRKSLAQWLWDSYRNARLIAHVGHWACREDAMDAYYRTSPTQILTLVSRL